VTINNLRVQGSDPCYWTNTLPYNPNSVGEKYSQYNPRREEQAAHLDAALGRTMPDLRISHKRRDVTFRNPDAGTAAHKDASSRGA
jgi:hypothetical protein